MIDLLDADLNGTDSIQSVIDSGKVNYLDCPTYEKFDEHVRYLLNHRGPGDTAILDTYTSILATTRGDFKHGANPDVNLWEERQIYFGDKGALNAYQAAGNMVMRRLKNLRARGISVVVLCHEDEALDETTMTKKRSPKANPEALDMLVSASSDIFRLIEATEDKLNADGSVAYPKGSRILQMRRSYDTLAKFHVAAERSESIANGMINPTMPKLIEHLGKVPSMLVIYGLPGSGKTTFSVSGTAAQGG